MYNKYNLIGGSINPKGLNVDPKFYLGGSNYLKCNEYLTIPNPINENQSYRVKCLKYDYKENVFNKAYEDIIEFMNNPTNENLIKLISQLPPKPRQRPNKLNNEEAIEAYKKRPSYKKVLLMAEEMKKKQQLKEMTLEEKKEADKEKRRQALKERSERLKKVKEQQLKDEQSKQLKGEGINFINNIKNKRLYNRIKKEIYEQYPKHSLFRSALIIKKYKEADGQFIKPKNKQESKLDKWFNEKWISLNDYLRDEIINCGSSNTYEKYNEYPLCRPLEIAKKLNKNQIRLMIDEKNKLKTKPLITEKILKTKKYNIR